MSRVVHQALSVLEPGMTPSYLVLEIPGFDQILVVEQKSQKVICELDNQIAACHCADTLAALSDLNHLIGFLGEDEDALIAICDLSFSQQENQNPSRQKLVLASTRIGVDDCLVRDGSFDITSEISDCFKNLQGQKFLDERPSTIIVQGFMPEGDEDDGAIKFIAVEIEYDELGLISAAGIHLLNNSYVLEKGGSTIFQLMLDISNSPQHSLYIDSSEERDDWLPVIEKMPLYSQKMDERERIYVYEGGAVLQALTTIAPWMVEQGQAGEPIPLRIVQARDDHKFGEIGMKLDAIKQSGMFLGDVLRSEAALTRQNGTQQAFERVVGVTQANWGVQPSGGLEKQGDVPSWSQAM